MSRIVLGETDSGAKVHLDVDSLIRNRLLVQANSGRGKSYLLRRIAEQLSGKIQVVIVDSEGEFASLREKYPYVLAGKGGETAADPRTAALLAGRLLELHASAVLDIYEMKPDSRHEFVMNFLDAMVDAPKALWHPVVVLLDEAHVFCPEKGQGESVAGESVINMASRGRKRGFALVAATQRLGKLSKNCSAELMNVLIGGTFQDIDRKRAAETLGIYGKDVHSFFDTVKMLKPGTFYGLGPAISEDLIVFKTGSIETTHPEAGAGRHIAPPATPANIEKFLPKLSDLPQEQEKKEQTVKDLNNQIRELKRQLKEPGHTGLSKPEPPQKVLASRADILQAIQGEIAPYKRELRDQRSQLRDLSEFSKKLIEKLQGLTRLIEDRIKDVVLSEFNPPDPDVAKIQESLQKPAQNIPKNIPPGFTPRKAVSIVAPANFEGELDGPQKKILTALGELRSIGINVAPAEQVAAWAGYSIDGGAFGNPRGRLNKAGLISYPRPGEIMLTELGLKAIGGEPSAPEQYQVQDRIMRNCDGPEQRILGVILAKGKGAIIPAQEVAEAAGYSLEGGAFGNPRGRLRTKGLIEYPSPGQIKAADWLFFEN